jgi:hypothetical protein
MRSKKRILNKHKKYHLVGGSFLDTMQTNITESVSNNSTVKSITDFFSQNTNPLDTIKQSLYTKISSLKENITNRVKGVICTSGGSKKTRKHSKRKNNKIRKLR